MEHELLALVRQEKPRAIGAISEIAEWFRLLFTGKNIGNLAIAVDASQINKILSESGSNALINMNIKENGSTKKYKVLVKAIQRDPVRWDLIHLDFHQVSLKDRVHTTVPIHLEGTPAGVQKGGILTHLARRVEVECQADRIPDSLVVDVSEMEIGDTLNMADLKLPEGVKILEDPAAPVVTVTAAERPEAEEEVPAPEEEPGVKEGEEQ